MYHDFSPQFGDVFCPTTLSKSKVYIFSCAATVAPKKNPPWIDKHLGRAIRNLFFFLVKKGTWPKCQKYLGTPRNSTTHTRFLVAWAKYIKKGEKMTCILKNKRATKIRGHPVLEWETPTLRNHPRFVSTICPIGRLAFFQGGCFAFSLQAAFVVQQQPRQMKPGNNGEGYTVYIRIL